LRGHVHDQQEDIPLMKFESRGHSDLLRQLSSSDSELGKKRRRRGNGKNWSPHPPVTRSEEYLTVGAAQE
jgi:hypothetical protein